MIFFFLALTINTLSAGQNATAFGFDAQSDSRQWVVYDWPELESGIAKVAWDNGALSIDCSQDKMQYGMASWLKNTIPAGTVVRCQVEVKTHRDVSASIGLAYHRHRLTDGKSRQGFVHAPVCRSAQWQRIEWETSLQTSPATALVLYASGQGEAWFRNLKVQIVSSNATPSAASQSADASAISWETEPQDVVANEGLYGKRLFHAIEGVALPIVFQYRGNVSELKAPALLIEVPPGMRIVASRCNHYEIFSAERVQMIQTTESGGQIYRIDQLGAMKRLKPHWGWRRSSAIYLLPERCFDETVTVKYARRDGDRQSPWESFEVKVLPPLQPLPGEPTVSIGCWHQKDMALPGNESMLETLLQTYQQAGINMAQIVRGDAERSKVRAFEQQLIKRGWTGFMPVSDAIYDPYWELKNTPLEKMISFDGKEQGVLCPSYVMQTPEIQAAYGRSLEKQIQAFELAATDGRKPWIALDLELWGSMEVKNACFCSRCRQTFADRLKLSDAPSAKEIQERYLPQWALFRHEQTDQVSRITADYIHRNHPNIIVAYYDYIIPLTPADEQRFLHRYPADTRKYDDDLDIHLLSLYRYVGTTFFDLLVHASRQLNKPVVPITFINNSSPAYARHAPRQVYMETMQAGLLGSPGLSIWTGEGLDGAYLHAMNQAQVDLAPWKETIGQSQWVRSDATIVPATASVRCIIRQGRDQILLAVFNYANAPVPSIEIESPVLEGYSGTKGNTYGVGDLLPESVRIVLLKKTQGQR